MKSWEKKGTNIVLRGGGRGHVSFLALFSSRVSLLGVIDDCRFVCTEYVSVGFPSLVPKGRLLVYNSLTCSPALGTVIQQQYISSIR